MEKIIQILGMTAACAMPLFNIPLIIHILKRKTSSDISLFWVFGVWTCILLMFPSAWISPDPIFRVFAILNVILFTTVVGVTWKYRKS